MTVVGERTWKELRGISCIDMESAPPAKKQICTSRSFGKMLTDIDTMVEVFPAFHDPLNQKVQAGHLRLFQ